MVSEVDAAVRPGDDRETAFPRLVETVGARLYNVGLRLCGSPQEAEDLVQEVFLRAWRNWDRFEGRSKVTTWLYTIAAHACQRMHRRRAGEPESMASFDEALPSLEPGASCVRCEPDDPEAEALRDEARRKVQEAISGLPDDYRLPVVFKEILGMSVAETAQALNLTPEAVKTRLHRARMKLRKELVEPLPKRDAPMPSYPEQVCRDLLEAKQAALDRGEPFPLTREAISERCRSVFETLDLTQDACRRVVDGGMPDDVRRRILESLSD